MIQIIKGPREDESTFGRAGRGVSTDTPQVNLEGCLISSEYQADDFPGIDQSNNHRSGSNGSARIAGVVGSRNLQHFDAALFAYLFATLFAVFGIAYRYSMWLQRPPTAMYWKRGWQVFFVPDIVQNVVRPSGSSGVSF